MRFNYFIFTFVSLLSFLMNGCQQQQPIARTGTVVHPDSELPTGSRFIDFEFTDQNNKTRTLMSVRGNYTVLMFTECKEKYTPYLNYIANYADTQSNWRVKIIAVNVYWQPGGCYPQKTCVCSDQPGNPHFISVCDGMNMIRSYYNIKNSGRFFVIGPNGKICTKGNLSDTDLFTSAMDKMTTEYMQEQMIFERD